MIPSTFFANSEYSANSKTMTRHIKSRGYDTAQASKQWEALRNSIDPLLVEEVNALARQRDRLVVNNSSPNPAVRASVALTSRLTRGMLLMQRRLVSAYRTVFHLRIHHNKAPRSPNSKCGIEWSGL
jgi:hypothetical protein